ncbi:MAG: transglutaminase-like domain-containing protein, partial [Armatimonadota bacterium]
MGAYVGESKVGYLTLKIDNAELDGTKGFRIASAVNTRLTVLGVDLRQEVTTVILTDSEYNPVYEEFTMSSGGKTTSVTARFTKKSVECVVSSGGRTSRKTISIPEGVSLVGDAMFATLDKVPQVGTEYRMHYFNPLTLAIEGLTVKAERRKRIEVGGKVYDAFVLSNVTPMGSMTIWQDETGEVLRVDAMMGIAMVKETREQATAGLGGTIEDFAVRTRVRTDKPIRSPREAATLDVILVGLDDPEMAISDTRQKAAPVKGRPGSVRFRVTASKFDARRSVMFPVKKAGFDEYLAPTAYVDSDSPAVKKQAAEIVAGTSKAWSACSKIRKWIHANLKVRADIGITRSASDVLESKSGVCRDFATLFAALARAVGIPAKVVSGILYLDDGFYYHAWVECWVGQWVPFDATMPTDFVDATHIKLAEGDATTMFALAKVIGSLSAEVK